MRLNYCNGFSTIKSIYFKILGDFSDPIDPDHFEASRDAYLPSFALILGVQRRL